MASDAVPNFQNPNLILVPQPPDFHLEIIVSPSHDDLHFWQFMVAGSIASTVKHMAMFLVDTIKTHMQALGACSIKSVGIWQALRSILKIEGPLGFCHKIAVMGLSAGPVHSIYFSVYECCKKSFSSGNPNNHAAAGVFATVASDAVFTSMDVVKQRLQLSNSPYKGLLDCVRRVVREEGVGAFYASYRMTVLMNAPFTVVHFSMYKAVKRGLMEVSPKSASDEQLVVHATVRAAAMWRRLSYNVRVFVDVTDL